MPLRDLDGFAHHCAAYANRLGEVILDREHFVGVELSPHDATTELVDDVLVQAQWKFSPICIH